MTILTDAVYIDGVLRPTLQLSLPNGAHVQMTVQTSSPSTDPLAAVVGIGDGPASGDVAARHDDYLYGEQF